jgi:hypothetical protein
MPDMQKKYKEEVRPALQAKLGLKSLPVQIAILFQRHKSKLA